LENAKKAYQENAKKAYQSDIFKLLVQSSTYDA